MKQWSLDEKTTVTKMNRRKSAWILFIFFFFRKCVHWKVLRDRSTTFCDNFIYWLFKFHIYDFPLECIPLHITESTWTLQIIPEHDVVIGAVNCANFNLDVIYIETRIDGCHHTKMSVWLDMWAFVYKQLEKLKIGNKIVYSICVIHVHIFSIRRRWHIYIYMCLMCSLYRSNEWTVHECGACRCR